MAIVGTQDEDEQNKNQIAQPTTSSSANAHAAYDAAQGKPYEGAGGGGGFVGGTGTGSGQGATTGAASPNPGGGGKGFTNLSQYLAANQGSGATTGQAAENVVQQSANVAKGAQGAFNTSGLNDINAAMPAVGVNKDVMGKISAGQANVDKKTMDQISGAGYTYSPPVGLSLGGVGTESDQDLDTAIQAGDDASKWSYGGPTDFSKVTYGGPAYDKVGTVQYHGPGSTTDFKGDTAAKQQAALAANDAAAGQVKNAQNGPDGISALLDQAYQQPRYTAGEKNLDTFLVGGTEGGKAALGKAAAVGQGVTGNYSKILSGLSGAIQKGKDTATATNNSYKDAIAKATANSNATRAGYDAAVKSTQASSAEAQKAAQAAATSAQAEKAKRAEREAQKPNNDGLAQFETPKINLNAQGFDSYIPTFFNGAKNAIDDSGNDGNQGYTPAIEKGITDVGNKAADEAKKVGNKISRSVGFGLAAAKGGEVPKPSYGNLVAKLRGKR